MNVLDENVDKGAQELLAAWRIRTHKIGVDLGILEVGELPRDVEQIGPIGIGDAEQGGHHLERQRHLQICFAEELRERLRSIGILAQLQHDARALLGVALIAHLGHQPFQFACIDCLDNRGLDLIPANRWKLGHYQ